MGTGPREHKWKAFVELDAGDAPWAHNLAAVCIRDVSFECSQAGLFLTRIAQVGRLLPFSLVEHAWNEMHRAKLSVQA